MSKQNRREFMGGAARIGLGISIVPRHVLGKGYQAPSDTLNVACIGVGGMGRSDVRGMSRENIYALCDVDLKAARSAFGAYSMYASLHTKTPPEGSMAPARARRVAASNTAPLGLWGLVSTRLTERSSMSRASVTRSGSMTPPRSSSSRPFMPAVIS